MIIVKNTGTLANFKPNLFYNNVATPQDFSSRKYPLKLSVLPLVKPNSMR